MDIEQNLREWNNIRTSLKELQKYDDWYRKWALELMEEMDTNVIESDEHICTSCTRSREQITKSDVHPETWSKLAKKTTYKTVSIQEKE